MKILITGSCGHIGSYLVKNLYKIKKIKKAILIDNLSSNKYCSLFNVNKKNNCEFFKIDLNDSNSLNKFKNIKVVFHFASMTNAELSFNNYNKVRKNNINCFKTVLKFCENTGAKLIHISSTSIYSKNKGVIDENCDSKYLIPQSPYAKIKLIEEKILKMNKVIKFNTFRFGTIAGVSPGMSFHTAVNSFCFNAAMNKPIRVYKTAINQFRPYLSIKDAFKLFKFCIENDFFENNTYNVISNNFTVQQILNKIKKIKKQIKITYVKSPIMNKLTYTIDKKKLSSKGLKLNSDLNQEIKDTLNLLKSNN